MKIFATFSTQPFFGEIAPIYTFKDLYRQVENRVGLLDLLEGEEGNLTEQDLLEVYQSVSSHDEIHLVNSFDELKLLSIDEKFQQLAELFVEHHSAA